MHLNYNSYTIIQTYVSKKKSYLYLARMHLIDQVTVKTFMLQKTHILNKYCSFELSMH